MKIVADRAPLLAALSACAPIAERRGTVPIMSHMRIVGGSDGLVKVAATDGNLTAFSEAPAEIAKAGACLVEAKAIVGLVSGLDSDTVALEVGDNNHLTVKAGKSHYNLLGRDAADFPALPDLPDAFEVMLAADLVSMLKRVRWSMCDNEAKPSCVGVHMLTSGDVLRAITATGLAMTRVQGKGVTIPKDGVTLSVRGAAEIVRLADDAKEVSIAFGHWRVSEYAFVKVGATTLAVQLRRDGFAPADRIISECTTKFYVTAKVDRGALARAVRRIETTATERGDMSVTIGDNLLVLSAEHVEHGSGNEQIDAEIDGNDLKTLLKIKDVSNILSVITSDRVCVSITLDDKREPSLSPVIFQPIDGDDVYLTMPLSPV